MLNKLTLRPIRSVSFGVMTYAVETVRSRPLRHRIYGIKNEGFRATMTELSASEPSTSMQGSANQTSIEFAQRTFKRASQFVIEFSAPFETQNFTDMEGLSGQLRVDERFGEIIGFEILENRLLVIQRFGLSTLESAFDPSAFKLRPLAKTYEAIVDGTARVLGETVIFLTKGGMCRIGRNARLQLLDIPHTHVANHNYTSTIHENRYHLQLPDRTLVIEKFLGSWFYLIPSATRLWESDNFSVGYAANRQFLKQIRLRTTADLTLTIMTEAREQRIQIKARDRTQTLGINLRGESFRLSIKTDSPTAQISELVAVIGFVT